MTEYKRFKVSPERLAQAQAQRGEGAGRRSLYPFNDLAVGEGFLVPNVAFGVRLNVPGFQSSRRYWERKLDWKFQTKTVSNGIEVVRWK